ncbi:MAG: signal peptide peptidase SppA [Anaerolineae bacterium]|nr:signal peptide peptidase SppA [Anaerolineae bacterium]
MNKKTWYWIIGAVLVGLVVLCGGVVSLGLLAANNLDTGGPTFGDAVAIVRVEGVIVAGEAPPPSPFGGGTGNAYSQQIIDYLKKAEANDSVKAIVLYVDSPGGSSFASDEIALQIQQMAKPIITSMGSMAASGGYYISAPTDEIWASSHSLTCSIGVISQFLNVAGFAEEYGITTVTITSGKFKDTGNPFRNFTPEEEALWQEIVDEVYDEFVQVVAEGRQMSEDEVRQIADGRICTGKQAQEMGLVDELGYLPDAIDRAAELGGIEGKPRLIEYKHTPTFWEALGASFNHRSPAEELQQLLNFHAGSPLMYLYVGP